MKHDANMHGRLPSLAPTELNVEQRAAYDGLSGAVRWSEKNGFRTKAASGEMLGPFNAFLHSPALATGYMSYQLIEARNTSLSPALREVVILTVGAVWDAAYELYAHRAVAATVGISAADVDRLCAGREPEEMGADAALLQRVVATLARERRLPDALYAEAAARFDPKTLVDIVFLAGSYMMVSALLNAFEVPVPTDAPSG